MFAFDIVFLVLAGLFLAIEISAFYFDEPEASAVFGFIANLLFVAAMIAHVAVS